MAVKNAESVPPWYVL